MNIGENRGLVDQVYTATAASRPLPRDENVVERFVKGALFSLVVSLVIFTNAITIGIQTDQGNKDDPDMLWDTFEIAFCIFYTVELLLRGYVFGWHCLRDHWFLFDALVVLGGSVDVVMGLIGFTRSDVAINLLRVIRLVKVVRLFRLFQFLRELMLLVNSIAAAMRTLVWTWVLLGLVIYVFAIVYTKVLGHPHTDDEVMQYRFGTVIRSAFTLFSILTLDWSNITLKVWDVEPMMVLVTIGFITITSFAIMNVVIAVIVESTMDQAMNNEDDRHAAFEREIKNATRKMVDIFVEADADSSGELTKAEFNNVIRSPHIQRALREMELDFYDLEYLFDLLDVNGNQTISMHEFVQGSLQVRGYARAKRLFELHCFTVRNSNVVNGQLKSIIRKQEEQDILLSRHCADIAELRTGLSWLYEDKQRRSSENTTMPSIDVVTSKEPLSVPATSSSNPNACDNKAPKEVPSVSTNELAAVPESEASYTPMHLLVKSQGAALEALQTQVTQVTTALESMERRQTEQMSVVLKAFEVQQASQTAHAAELEAKLKALQEALPSLNVGTHFAPGTRDSKYSDMEKALDALQGRIVRQFTELGDKVDALHAGGGASGHLPASSVVVNMPGASSEVVRPIVSPMPAAPLPITPSRPLHRRF